MLLDTLRNVKYPAAFPTPSEPITPSVKASSVRSAVLFQVNHQGGESISESRSKRCKTKDETPTATTATRPKRIEYR